MNDGGPSFVDEERCLFFVIVIILFFSFNKVIWHNVPSYKWPKGNGFTRGIEPLYVELRAHTWRFIPISKWLVTTI